MRCSLGTGSNWKANPVSQVKSPAPDVLALRETQFPFLAGCDFSHARRRPSAGRMHKHSGRRRLSLMRGNLQEARAPEEGWSECKLSPGLPSLIPDCVSESSSPQLRRILLRNRVRAAAECSRPEAVGWAMRWLARAGGKGGVARFKYQK